MKKLINQKSQDWSQNLTSKSKNQHHKTNLNGLKTHYQNKKYKIINQKNTQLIEFIINRIINLLKEFV